MSTSLQSAAVRSCSEQLRMPLKLQTNSPSLVVDQHANLLRRKPTFVRRIDSSEEPPSSHDSIFEAEYLSNANSEDNGYKSETLQAEAFDLFGRNVFLADRNENQRINVVPSIGANPIIYGHGTPLTTITEQKSTTTMRTTTSTISRSRSASDIASIRAKSSYQLLHYHSFELSPNVTIRPPRRKSFSADDAELVQLTHSQARITPSTALAIHEHYAQPRQPIIPPLYRPSTPPGLPSWTAAQDPFLRNGALQPQSWGIRGQANRIRRYFGLEPIGRSSSSRIPIPVHGNGPIVSASRSPRGVPRFRPPRSGHGQPLELHPFHLNSPPIIKGSPLDPEPPNQFERRNITPCARVKKLQPKRNWRQRVRFAQDPQHIAVNTLRETPPGETAYTTSKEPKTCHHHRRNHTSLRNPSSIREPTPNRPLLQLALDESSTTPHIPSTEHTIADSSTILPCTSSPFSLSEIPMHAAEPATANCWKCCMELIVRRIEGWWGRSKRWCCWMCCGVDLDEGEAGIETPAGRTNTSVDQQAQGAARPRRVVLDIGMGVGEVGGLLR